MNVEYVTQGGGGLVRDKPGTVVLTPSSSLVCLHAGPV